MRLYPDVPARRTAAIAVDAGTLLALVLLAWLGLKVHGAVGELTVLGRGVADAGEAVEGAFGAAGGAVEGTPVIGGDLAGALRDAGAGTGGEAAAAGREGEERVRSLASLLGWLTFLIPAGLLLSRVVPPRVGQVRALTAAGAALRDLHDPARRGLLAQRAAFGLPYARLMPFTRDPLGDLAAGRHEALIAAALHEAGLRGDPPPRGGEYQWT
jgi:hypothetical protein